MIGDLILWFKRIVKQHISCRHNYQPDRIGVITGLFYGEICTKCNKMK